MEIKGVWKIKYMEMLIGEDVGVKKSIAELLGEGDPEAADMEKMRWIFLDNTYMVGEVKPKRMTKKYQGARIYENKYVVADELPYEKEDSLFILTLDGETEGLSEDEIMAMRTVKTEGDMLILNALIGLYYLEREE